ncbi:hypothetical protein G3T14_15660 [Methylobacterium sp. BTF04]|uniref:hypothetical protein n=1 Tax=Methylobacterium sp. BTF04 TaxID=2708300 RepID=UPI0013D4FE59|nr:hypothetical protein [Methylobacterium sp. BTF04]NEU13556.1 hypothetical protein [Methylobacterium sp. BTF04]
MIPCAILPKLAKLLPLLASDNDGEVVATARAIQRTLSAAGSDFHALAKALTEDTPTVVAHRNFGEDFNFADAFRKSGPTSRDPDNPDARTRKLGLPIWGVQKLESWASVSTFCLSQNWDTPKRFGGKFLTRPEINRLREIERGRGWPTNAEAAWIETVIARLHQARDAMRTEGRRS